MEFSVNCEKCREKSVHNRFTFASDVRAEPLSRVVVEKAFGMGEPDCEVSGIAGVLEDRLEREGDSVG